MKKRLKVVNQSDCLKCLACEAACSMAFYKEFDPSKASIYVTEKNNEPKTVVCVQCGKCARTCEYDAITQNKRGVYVINKNCARAVVNVQRYVLLAFLFMKKKNRPNVLLVVSAQENVLWMF